MRKIINYEFRSACKTVTFQNEGHCFFYVVYNVSSHTSLHEQLEHGGNAFADDVRDSSFRSVLRVAKCEQRMFRVFPPPIFYSARGSSCARLICMITQRQRERKVPRATPCSLIFKVVSCPRTIRFAPATRNRDSLR